MKPRVTDTIVHTHTHTHTHTHIYIYIYIYIIYIYIYILFKKRNFKIVFYYKFISLMEARLMDLKSDEL